LGDVVRLTLAYNRGAATGVLANAGSRWLLIGAAVVVIAVLWRAYQRTAPADTTRLVALALVTGGALTTGALLLAWALQHRPEGPVEVERERPGPTA
jgi:lipoprotein signal peptidase